MKILVDTSVWSLALRKKTLTEKEEKIIKELHMREILPTLLDSGDRAFFLRVPNLSGDLTNEVQVFCVKDGKVNRVSTTIIDPSKSSITPGVIFLTFPDGSVDKMFVWQPKGR